MTVLGKLRKYGLNKILAAVIAFTLLCVPFSAFAASWPEVPPVILNPFVPPELGYSFDGTYYHYRCILETYIYTLPSGWSPDSDRYVSYLYDFRNTQEFTVSYRVSSRWNVPRQLELVPSITSGFTGQVSQIWSNGNFGWSSPVYINNNVPPTPAFQLCPINGNAQWAANSFVAYVLDDGLYDSTTLDSSYFLHSQFITFGSDVPEQTQYKSVLAEPVPDTHNRYFIANDKLYWISYYFDNLWVDPITAYNITSHSNEMTAVVTGTASDPNDGDIYYNYDVSITYNDKYYYPLQYMSSDYSFEDMCCPALIYTSSGLRLTFAFDQLSDVLAATDDILVDYRIYCSSFNLITGEYIDSVYSANAQVNNADINISISLDDELSNIYCYGVNFVNSANLPVNLASVLWSYDYVFETWRTDMYVKLAGIYNLLAQSETPSTTTPVDYASMLNDSSALDGYNAEDAGPLLSEAASKAQAQIGDGMAWGSEQIQSIFGIAPEMYLVVIIALAFGLAVLILGKKKSDN